MAYVLIGGTAVGTVLTLAFLPALYAIWFRVSYVDEHSWRENGIMPDIGTRTPPLAKAVANSAAWRARSACVGPNKTRDS